MFIANEIGWDNLNDAFIIAMSDNSMQLVEDGPNMDEELRCHDVMYTMQ